MTREQKEQEIRNKVQNLEHLNDLLIDVILSILENGGDGK